MKQDDTIWLIGQIRQEADEILIRRLKNAHVEGIVPSHGAILAHLFAEKKLPMNVLAAKIAKTPQTVTTLVQKLVALGYLNTEKNGADRRTTLVSLTAQGEALQPVFMDISEELYKRQYAGMSEQEISELRRLLNIVALNLS